MLSRGHYQNEAVGVNRHRRLSFRLCPIRNSHGLDHRQTRHHLTETESITRSNDGLDVGIFTSSGLRCRLSSRWRHRSFGQAGTTSWAHRGIWTGWSHAGNTQFYHDINHHDGGVHDQQRRFIILLLARFEPTLTSQQVRLRSNSSWNFSVHLTAVHRINSSEPLRELDEMGSQSAASRRTRVCHHKRWDGAGTRRAIEAKGSRRGPCEGWGGEPDAADGESGSPFTTYHPLSHGSSRFRTCVFDTGGLGSARSRANKLGRRRRRRPAVGGRQ